jgi:hypothetical protein
MLRFGSMMQLKPPFSLLLIPLLISNLFSPPAVAQPAASISIVVVAGEGAINNVNERVTRDVIVLVEDQNHKPVMGAAVSFFLPNEGPGGTFPNGTNSLTTTTNEQGRAAARGIQFNNQAGPMPIRVSASYAGRTASIVINQSNVTSGTSSSGRGIGGGAGGGMSRTTKILIIGAIVGGGAAAGIILGSKGSSSTPAAAPLPTVTITPGVVTVGGPQ